MHARFRGLNNLSNLEPHFPCLADEIAEPCPDMNINVTAFTVSEKSINAKYEMCEAGHVAYFVILLHVYILSISFSPSAELYLSFKDPKGILFFGLWMGSCATGFLNSKCQTLRLAHGCAQNRPNFVQTISHKLLKGLF